MIAKELIEQIRNKADIVKVVSEYVSLRKRGKNYLGLCPFHSEKTASFTVSQEKQIFHCFGCNEGGNVFAFIMKIENVSFAEAVAELGEQLGITVPKSTGERQTQTEKEKLYQVMTLATDFFRQNLKSTAGVLPQKYLSDRQITEQTSETFSLGFAPAAWDGLSQHLISRGVDPLLLEKAGLGLKREGGTGYYDRFRNRLIIPIADQRGRVIAFGGRSLGNEEPKYLNSPETAIYHKGEALFGLNLTKESIKKQQAAILVEGYFDLIIPYQNGITNIAATLGTALTPTQCQILARQAGTVILAFDSDAAGGTAAERSISLLREVGLKVKVAILSGGKDPDEIIRRQGKAMLEKCLASALPYLEFKLQRIVARHDVKNIESRGEALKEAAKILATENDQFVFDEYCRLAGELLHTSQEAVAAEARRQQHYQFSRQANLRRVTAKPTFKQLEAEKALVTMASQDNKIAQLVKENLQPDDFQLAEGREIAELIFTIDLGQSESPAHFLLDNLPGEPTRQFLAKLLLKEEATAGARSLEIANDCITVLKQDRRHRRVEELKTALLAAEQGGDSHLAGELLNKLKSEIS